MSDSGPHDGFIEEKKDTGAKPGSLATTRKQVGLGVFTAVELIKNPEMLDALLSSSIVSKNVKREQVIGAIMTGHEFGISPMRSIMLLDILTPANAPKIHKGISLGLDIVESVNSIFIINDNVVVGGNAMIAVLRKNRIQVILRKDAEPIYRKIGLSGKYKEHVFTDREATEFKDYLVMLNQNLTQPQIDELKQKKPGVIFYQEILHDWITEIEFRRPGFEPHVGRFTYNQALEAGIVNDKDGNVKPPWKNKGNMLKHKILGSGGRFIAGDIVGSAYTMGEAMEFDDNLPFVDADIIE